ncbi:hypothetical protein B0H11DRAFT_2252285 [Mycena galericulata]|nr:hypothetical protein B0H11DRAFT_2252285 [Mycena galericulata]
MYFPSELPRVVAVHPNPVHDAEHMLNIVNVGDAQRLLASTPAQRPARWLTTARRPVIVPFLRGSSQLPLPQAWSACPDPQPAGSPLRRACPARPKKNIPASYIELGWDGIIYKYIYIQRAWPIPASLTGHDPRADWFLALAPCGSTSAHRTRLRRHHIVRHISLAGPCKLMGVSCRRLRRHCTAPPSDGAETSPARPARAYVATVAGHGSPVVDRPSRHGGTPHAAQTRRRRRACAEYGDARTFEVQDDVSVAQWMIAHHGLAYAYESAGREGRAGWWDTDESHLKGVIIAAALTGYIDATSVGFEPLDPEWRKTGYPGLLLRHPAVSAGSGKNDATGAH